MAAGQSPRVLAWAATKAKRRPMSVMQNSNEVALWLA